MEKIPGFRTPSIRVRMDNPDHHIWDNNGTWFIRKRPVGDLIAG